MDMQQILAQAQAMQQQLMDAQDNLGDIEVSATAGGGMVNVTAAADMRLTSVTIDPEAVDPDDVEMLEVMILVAVNEALRGVAQQGEARINAATGGMSIPGLF